MRIAFISYEYPPDTGKGGIGTYTIQVATMLAKNNWDIHVFAGSNTRQCLTITEGVKVHWIKSRNATDFCLNSVEPFTVENELKNFDIIESAEIHGNAWAIKKAFPQVPLFVRLHAPNWLVEHYKKHYISLIAKFRFVLGSIRLGKPNAGYWRKYDFTNDPDYQFTLMADVISAPSATMKNWAIENWKLPASKIEVIANPFSASYELINLPIHLKNTNKQIVFFGRLNVLKGLVNATLAMKRILKEFPNYTFKLIGDDGPGINNVSMQCWMERELLPFIDRVFFLKGLAYEKLPQEITEAEIVLLPSLFESFSYTCAEAMAAGKVVIGSRRTGMADLIDNNNTGILIDADNKTKIYDAIKFLILNDNIRYSMATNARKSIVEKFSSDKILKEYINFYEKNKI